MCLFACFFVIALVLFKSSKKTIESILLQYANVDKIHWIDKNKQLNRLFESLVFVRIPASGDSTRPLRPESTFDMQHAVM